MTTSSLDSWLIHALVAYNENTLLLRPDNPSIHGGIHIEDTFFLFLGNRSQYILASCNENIRLFREDNLSAGDHDHTSDTSLLVVGEDSSHHCHAFVYVSSCYGSTASYCSSYLAFYHVTNSPDGTSFFLLGCDRHGADYTLALTSVRCPIVPHRSRILKWTNPSA